MTTHALAPSPHESHAKGHKHHEYPPGDLAIWVFILAELSAFFVLFAAYAFTRLKHLDLFNDMQRTLDADAGMLNTLLLITGSWCVARAIAAIKRNHSRQSAHWLMAGILTGVGFLIVKFFEYGAKFDAGINLETNLFYTFYLALTMFHAMHVVLGMAILLIIWKKTMAGGYSAQDHHGMETGASYWHMVDLVWIILFPLVYVMR
ncbi:MAG: cytochrome c oxidase subunit 3 family protein [Rhodocyclaceae bacterium]|nr:cytochrome c oxidase subunit 3 family protein [Rhodocyclaceae bacterium]MDZ4215308.1 cytochrome c oxidase subunit 3 family protein [Rhodocyclaceae bacterium]